MANTRLDFDKIFEKVIACRQSGLSDREWCISQGISPSTFYNWVCKLRERACCEIPESEAKKSKAPISTPHQDVVKINITPDQPAYPSTNSLFQAAKDTRTDEVPIEIQLQGMRICIRNSADPMLLASTIKLMKGLLC